MLLFYYVDLVAELCQSYIPEFSINKNFIITGVDKETAQIDRRVEDKFRLNKAVATRVNKLKDKITKIAQFIREQTHKIGIKIRIVATSVTIRQ